MRIPNRVFRSLIPTKNFLQSFNPDGFYWLIPIPTDFFSTYWSMKKRPFQRVDFTSQHWFGNLWSPAINCKLISFYPFDFHVENTKNSCQVIITLIVAFCFVHPRTKITSWIYWISCFRTFSDLGESRLIKPPIHVPTPWCPVHLYNHESRSFFPLKSQIPKILLGTLIINSCPMTKIAFVQRGRSIFDVFNLQLIQTN